MAISKFDFLSAWTLLFAAISINPSLAAVLSSNKASGVVSSVVRDPDAQGQRNQQETPKFVIQDPIFEWDGFRLNVDYPISSSIVAEQVTMDIVSDRDCEGGIIERFEIETDFTEVSETRVRLSLLMNPENIHAARYVFHHEKYEIVGVCARIWINKPEEDRFEPHTADRRDYFWIEAELEDLKGIHDVLEDKTKFWGVDTYRCNESKQPLGDNAPAIRNGEKLRLCLKPTQRTIDDGVHIGAIKTFHFHRDDKIQKSVATYGTDKVTKVYDCDRGSDLCVIETVLKNDFFDSPGEVKAEGAIFMQYGYEPEERRELSGSLRTVTVPVKLNNLDGRSLYNWWGDGEIVDELNTQTMIDIVPMEKTYKAEAFPCDENNNPIKQKKLNSTSRLRLCIQPDEEARDEGVYVNSIESFSYALANDNTRVQEAIDFNGYVNDDDRTIVDCIAGSRICSVDSKLMDWFFDKSAKMVATGYAVLQFGNNSEERRRAEVVPRGLSVLNFAGRDQVEAFYDTIARSKSKDKSGMKNWFESLFDRWDVSDTHMTILYIVAIVLFVLICLCCCAGMIFLFWYRRDSDPPKGGRQSIDIKINQGATDGEEDSDHQSRRYSNSTERQSRRGSSGTERQSRRGSSGTERMSRRGSNSTERQSRRGSNGTERQSRRGSNGTERQSRRGSNSSRRYDDYTDSSSFAPMSPRGRRTSYFRDEPGTPSRSSRSYYGGEHPISPAKSPRNSYFTDEPRSPRKSPRPGKS